MPQPDVNWPDVPFGQGTHLVYINFRCRTGACMGSVSIITCIWYMEAVKQVARHELTLASPMQAVVPGRSVNMEQRAQMAKIVGVAEKPRGWQGAIQGIPGFSRP